MIDSCGELPEDLKKDGHYQNVSLELEVDGCYIRDDETFDQKDFLRRVKESVTGPKSACPSPDEYMKSYEGDADHVYVVTLSGKLSGSYNLHSPTICYSKTFYMLFFSITCSINYYITLAQKLCFV